MRWGRLGGLVFGLALVVLPGVAYADDDISEEARTHFRAGVAFLKDPDGERPEEAYAEFKVAYQLSKSPKVLGNLGLCAMKLERDGEAIEAFTRYAMEVSDIDEAERRQINQDIATLKASAVKLTLKVDKPQSSLLDTRTPVRGAPITNSYGPFDNQLEIVVRAGHHRIRAKAGAAEADWEFDALPGTPITHDFRLTAAPEVKPVVAVVPSIQTPANETTTPATARSRTWPIVTMAAGGTLLVAGAITGFAALRRINQLDDTCPNDECPANFDYGRATSDARRIVTATDILLVTGGIVTVAGLTWFLLTPGRTEPAKPVATTANASCSSNGCGAWVQFVLP